MNFNNNSAIGENATYVVDVKGRNNCTCSGSYCPSYNSSGKFGGAFNYRVAVTTNVAFNCGNDSSLNTVFGTKNFTMEALINHNGYTGDYEGIINKRTSAFFSASPGGLFINSNSNQLSFLIGTGNESSTYTNLQASIPNQTWVHVVATANVSNMYLYINGVLVGQSTVALTPPINTEPLTIGAFYSNVRSFNGTIDEVRIYNRSLSADEIWMHYQSEFQKYNSTQYRLYDNLTNLTEGSYQYYIVANDSAGNSNQSELRALAIDTITPNISFVSPTDDNNSFVNRSWTYINVSTNETNSTAFIDFNRSLVGWWRFNNEAGENSTFFKDYSSYQNNGTCSGTACPNFTSAGKFGGAYNYNGTSNYLEMGNPASLQVEAGNFTVSSWFYTKDARCAVEIVDKSANLICGATGNGGWSLGQRFGITQFIVSEVAQSRGVIATDTVVRTNQWVHAVGVRNGDMIYLYINGALVNSTNASGINITSTRTLRIGGHITAWFMNGTVDDVQIFNRALSPEEINASYNAGSYRLYHNFTNLTEGNYNYTAYVQDSAGNINPTETRSLGVDTITPAISFVTPTVLTNGATNNSWLYVNTTVNDTNPMTSFVDFNRSLVGWWRFNNEAGENSTFFKDYSSYQNNGTCSGTTCPSITTAGKFGGAYNYNGSQKVTIANTSSQQINNAITFEAWIKPQGTSNYETIAYKDYAGDSADYWLACRNTGTVLFYLYGIDTWAINGNSVLYNGETHHVVFTYDSNTSANNMRFYIDGNLTAQKTNAGTIKGNINRSIVLGGSGGNFQFNGTIDEVKIWNRTLSPEEINASFNAGSYRLYHNFTNLTDGYYNYNVYVQDASGNTNSSTVTNALVDTIGPALNFTSPTQSNSAYITQNFTELNATLDEINPNTLAVNWYNGTTWINSTVYDDSLVLAMNFNNNSAIGDSSTIVKDISKYRNDGTIVTGSSWWSDSYKYRLKLNLTNIGGSTIYIGDPLNFTIDTAALVSQGKLLSTGNDLRIVCSGTEVNRTNTTDFNSNQTIIWFNSCLQINNGSSSGSNIYVYYGNSVAGSPQTGGINTNTPFGLNQSLDIENIVRAQYSPGKFGSGLQFDGVDDYVNLGSGDSFDSLSNPGIDATFEAWIKTKNGGPIVAKYLPYYFIVSGGHIGGLIYNGTGSVGGGWAYSSAYVNDSVWHHAVWTVDREGYSKFYVDGLQSGTPLDVSSNENNTWSKSANMVIGSRDGSYGFFNGSIDELRIYNRSLSPDEILLHYQSELSKYTPAQYAFYDNLSLQTQIHSFKLSANDSSGSSSLIQRTFHINTINITNLSFADSSTYHSFNISANATHVNGTFSNCYIRCDQCSPSIKQKTPTNSEGNWSCSAVINTSGGDLTAALGTNLSLNISFVDNFTQERYSSAITHTLPDRAPTVLNFNYTNLTSAHGFSINLTLSDSDLSPNELSNCKIHYISDTSPEVSFDGTLNSTSGGQNITCAAQITNDSTFVQVISPVEFWAVITDSSGEINLTSHHTNSIVNRNPTIQTVPYTQAYQTEHSFNVSASVNDSDFDALTCKAYLSKAGCFCESPGVIYGTVGSNAICIYKVTNGTCDTCSFEAKDWIDIIVEASDSWSSVNSSLITQQLINRVPSAPQNLTLIIGDNFNNSSRVTTLHPIINWSNVPDAESDALTIYSSTGASINPVAQDNSAVSPDSSMQLGQGVSLARGQMYYFRIRACDDWDCSLYTPNGSFYVNSLPRINFAYLNQTSNLTIGSIVHLVANISDPDNYSFQDNISWANFTVWSDNSTINSTEGIELTNLNSTKDGDYYTSPNFSLDIDQTYYWNLTASDGFEVSSTDGSFTISNSQPRIVQGISFHDIENHTFSANATGTDDDLLNIENCTITMSDQQSHQIVSLGTWSPLPDSHSYLCDYNVSANLSQYFTVGELITVKIRFYDESGSYAESTDSHQIPNTKPNLTSSWIEPVTPSAATNLIAQRTFGDAENDSVSDLVYLWYKNGAQEDISGRTIAYQNLRKGENWSFCLQVKDQYNAISDEVCSANVTISNSLPQISNFSVQNLSNHTLGIYIQASDYDNKSDISNCAIYYTDGNNSSINPVIFIDSIGLSGMSGALNITAGGWFTPMVELNLTAEVCDGNLSGGSVCVNASLPGSLPNIEPVIVNLLPENNTLSRNLTQNISWSVFDSDLDNLTYQIEITNAIDSSSQTIRTNKTYYSISFTEGVYSWEMFASDLFGSKNLSQVGSGQRNLSLDNTPPTLINTTCRVDGISSGEVFLNESGEINLSQGDNISCVQEWQDNSLAWNPSGLENATLQLMPESGPGQNLTYRFTGYNLSFSFSNISAGQNTINITAFDWIGNNKTEQLNLSASDNEAPSITSLWADPNTSSSLDPYSNFSVYANLSDNLQVDKAVIYFMRNDSLNSTGWNLSEMSQVNGTYRADFNLSEGNWTFYILANDSSGNYANSSVQNLTLILQVWRDYGINAGIYNSPQSSPVGQNFTIGTLSIQNDGDANYTCALPDANNIIVTPYEGIVNFSYGNSTLSIAPGSTLAEDIYASGNMVGVSSVKIPVDCSCLDCTENSSDYTKSFELETTIRITPAGPYFEMIGSSRISALSAGQVTSATFGLRNIGNESASDMQVSVENVPAGLSAQPITNDTISLFQVNTYETVSYSLLASPSAKTGNYCFNISSDCSNCDYQVLSEVCVPIDGAAVEVAVPGASVGGGKASPAYAGLTSEQINKLLNTRETFELVRNQGQNFTLVVQNIFSGDMENVSIDVSGYMSQYLQVSPKQLDTIPQNESRDVIITIIAPKYFTSGTYRLNFTIAADVVERVAGRPNLPSKVTHMKEYRLVTLIIQEISLEEANEDINESGAILEEFKEKGFNSRQIESLLSQSKLAVESGRNIDAQTILESIKSIRQSAYDASNGLAELEQLISQAETKEVSVEETKRLLNLAKAAFARGDYASALSRVHEAEMVYATETKGEFSIPYFVKANWPYLTIALAASLILAFIASLFLRLAHINAQLRSLKKEEGILLGMMKQCQRDCFESKKLSMEEYEDALLHYESRLSKVEARIVDLTTKKESLFHIGGNEEALRNERKELVRLIEDLQRSYLEKKTIETRIYNNRIKSYAKRFSEIEETLATMEAEREIREKTSFSARLSDFIKRKTAKKEGNFLPYKEKHDKQ